VITLIILWKKMSKKYLVLFAIFWVYMMFVVGLTIFPLIFPLQGEQRLPTANLLSRVNLVPFYFGRGVRFSLRLKSEQMLNILMLVPFGLILPMITRINLKRFVWLAVGIGLSIELIQLFLIFITGGSYYRIADINDVLFNFIGAMFGFGIFSFFRWRSTGIFL
jgi:glycopeptide antibiotics resistance protein